jgi:hypothetical protein
MWRKTPNFGVSLPAPRPAMTALQAPSFPLSGEALQHRTVLERVLPRKVPDETTIDLDLNRVGVVGIRRLGHKRSRRFEQHPLPNTAVANRA